MWVRLNIAAIYQGKPLNGYVEIVEDITERKSREACLHQAKVELYAEKERAQITLNSIVDAVLATDGSGCISYLNKVAEDIFIGSIKIGKRDEMVKGAFVKQRTVLVHY